MPFTSSGSPMISAIVMRGLSEENGSWKIICICRRSGRSALRGRRATSISAPLSVRKRISPAVGAIARRMQREVVVLPQPRLADQRQRLAAVDGEAHVVDRAHLADDATEQAAVDGIVFAQSADVEDAGHANGRRGRSPNPLPQGEGECAAFMPVSRFHPAV